MTPSTLNATKWTVDDYHRMIEAGILSDRQVELLNGVIVDMSPEGTSHAAYSQDFADYLRSVLGNRVRIREAKPVTLSPNSEPEPDIAVVAPHPVSVYLEHHPYPADIFWVIEYSNSSLTKDLEAKNVIYAAASIPEYWVVNLKTKELILFREPQPTGYRLQTPYTAETIAPLAFPEVAIAVSRLLNG
ncbi:MAG: Uma2 family endonuclease [Oculatellaceae cyanobacterium bins.114]|nr:Uma2 family endonuclease [Oculatellaceae cyanobacterium bins.114]